jgi:hypothetical protein
MALVRCILGKFLGVVCHCFPPHLDVLIFAARFLHVHNDARHPSSERWYCQAFLLPTVIVAELELTHTNGRQQKNLTIPDAVCTVV